MNDKSLKLLLFITMSLTKYCTIIDLNETRLVFKERELTLFLQNLETFVRTKDCKCGLDLNFRFGERGLCAFLLQYNLKMNHIPRI